MMLVGRCASRVAAISTAVLLTLGVAGSALAAEPTAPRGASDSRLRSVIYSVDEVYRLRGYAGYQIDLEFEAGESFVGLGAGDVEALAFVAQGNHLFIKPRAVNVRTNLTVLTTRRSYHFEYLAAGALPDAAHVDVVYVLRFLFPPAPAVAASRPSPEETLAQAVTRARNTDYWYCGGATLQPLAAWDDGVHTHLQFSPRAELPALFVRNDDGTESLLNFSIDAGDVLIHRIAARFIVRRGKLTGCIVNKAFAGGGARLESGTVAPDVIRERKDPHP